MGLSTPVQWHIYIKLGSILSYTLHWPNFGGLSQSSMTMDNWINSGLVESSFGNKASRDVLLYVTGLGGPNANGIFSYHNRKYLCGPVFRTLDVMYWLKCWFSYVKRWNWYIYIYISGLLCQKQVSRAGTSNYIPQFLWDVITRPWPWYLLLAQYPSFLIFPMHQNGRCRWLGSMTKIIMHLTSIENHKMEITLFTPTIVFPILKNDVYILKHTQGYVAQFCLSFPGPEHLSVYESREPHLWPGLCLGSSSLILEQGSWS